MISPKPNPISHLNSNPNPYPISGFFTNDFPIETTLRIWDLILVYGYHMVFPIGIALLEKTLEA